MQALILAGGKGTRLRPLTTTVPKPVVTIADRPHIVYMLEWLKGHGVDDVVLACGFLADGVREVLGDGSAHGVAIRYLQEPRPLDTGGALKFAEGMLDERFFMLNGDVLCDLDLTAQLAQHEQTGARCTLALYGVQDPSAYGLVRLTPDNAVTEFVEKPSADQIDTNNISAGAYVLERSVCDLLASDRPASIERDVFPRLVGDGLYGWVGKGYWMDIGSPGRYLEATFDILEGTVATAVAQRMGAGAICIEPGARVEGKVIGSALVEDGASIAAGARVGARVVIGHDASIGAGSTVERSVIMAGARVGANCRLSACVLAPGAVVGDECVIAGETILGDGVRIGAGNILSAGARLFPGVELGDNAIKIG